MGVHKRETSASSQMSRERLEAIVGRPQVRLSTGHDNKQRDALIAGMIVVGAVERVLYLTAHPFLHRRIALSVGVYLGTIDQGSPSPRVVAADPANQSANG